jgi:uncharacterized protein (DUF433 family)
MKSPGEKVCAVADQRLGIGRNFEAKDLACNPALVGWRGLFALFKNQLGRPREECAIENGYDSSMVIPSRIVLDSTVAHGRPIIRGTRLPISIVVGSLAGGMTFEEIQQEYDITVDDIRAALKFVADLADNAVVSLIEKLKSLTPEQRAEAEDFVNFLKARKERARDAAAHHLGAAFAKLDARNLPAPSQEEVQAEIDAARTERRARDADRR